MIIDHLITQQSNIAFDSVSGHQLVPLRYWRVMFKQVLKSLEIRRCSCHAHSMVGWSQLASLVWLYEAHPKTTDGLDSEPILLLELHA